jgi:hypothetical protein
MLHSTGFILACCFCTSGGGQSRGPKECSHGCAALLLAIQFPNSDLIFGLRNHLGNNVVLLSIQHLSMYKRLFSSCPLFFFFFVYLGSPPVRLGISGCITAQSNALNSARVIQGCIFTPQNRCLHCANVASPGFRAARSNINPRSNAHLSQRFPLGQPFPDLNTMDAGLIGNVF